MPGVFAIGREIRTIGTVVADGDVQTRWHDRARDEITAPGNGPLVIKEEAELPSNEEQVRQAVEGMP
ncbi:hypothetical protein [Caulifigura coniformis]|nr:hypothetical protein [Caulifigura coniformis]